MPISDPRDRFFYPHHTHMKDTYIIPSLPETIIFSMKYFILSILMRLVKISCTDVCPPVREIIYSHGLSADTEDNPISLVIPRFVRLYGRFSTCLNSRIISSYRQSNRGITFTYQRIISDENMEWYQKYS